VGLRDCELTGRVAPKPYDMGFKRSTQQAVWADRSSVDEFNRALIAARNARPATASADEKAYVPSSQETWVRAPRRASLRLPRPSTSSAVVLRCKCTPAYTAPSCLSPTPPDPPRTNGASSMGPACRLKFSVGVR
jgi:hypothetical protein